MEDLIVVTAYCPDKEREELLLQCIKSLIKYKDKYKILIVSHTFIPKHISDEVDYTIYDKENDLIKDPRYWLPLFFIPYEGLKITSTFVKKNNASLSVLRMLVSAISLAKSFNFKKIHYIEYDTYIEDIHEIEDNSFLLEENDSVFYYENNTPFPDGRFFSFRVDTVDEIYNNFNEERFLNIIKKLPYKTIESFNQNFFTKDFKKVISKNKDTLKDNISVNLSMNTDRFINKSWAVPYYDKKDDKIKLVTWNKFKEEPINVRYVINDDKEIQINNLQHNHWRLGVVGKIDKVNKIEVYIDDTLNKIIDFNDFTIESFKESNYCEYT